MSSLSTKALVEIRDITNRAQILARGTHSQRKEADVLLSRVAAIRASGISTDEARQRYVNGLAREMGMPEVDFEKEKEQRAVEHVFREFLQGRSESELRDMAAGGAAITYTQGPEGGFGVPMSFYNQVITGIKQLTPLLNEDVVTVIPTDNGRPLQVPGFDLTSISASRVSENTQQTKASPPAASQTVLRGLTYRTDPIAVSIELEQDALPRIIDLLAEAFSIGLARGIGSDLAKGDGNDKCHGLLPNAPTVMQTASPAAITANELLTVFHGVNKIHRANPKCAWLFSETQWEVIRKTATTSASNSGWRVLLDDAEDDELLGKPVYVDPNLSDSLPSSEFAFGNLSRFVVRATQMRVQRYFESPFIEYGQFLYRGLVRVDSAIIQPGNDTPIVTGRFSS